MASAPARTHAHADRPNDDDDDMFNVTPEEMDRAAKGRLCSFVERIERLQKEKAEIAEQEKEVFAELKGEGFDPKITRKVIAIRKKDRAKRLEEEALVDLYLATLGEI